MTKYTFVPNEVRLLPRDHTEYKQVSPDKIVVPSGAITDARDAASQAPRVFTPSDQVELISLGGRYLIASRGEKAYRDVLAILAAKENGDKVRAKVYAINVGDPELYIQSLYGDLLDEETAAQLEDASNQPVVESRLGGLGVLEEALEGDSSDLYAYLVDYATSIGQNVKKVPLLVGHTGVGKSALVKKLEQEEGPDGYGYRVHTIKAGFMDKVDLLGYVQVKEDPETGARVAQDSPMYELMISTDAFLQTVRDTLSKIDPNTLTYNDGTILHKVSREQYERLKFLAKTPVLFFDEINRADPFIISTLMTLFSERKLNNYSFGKAVFITAANWPIDITSEELEALYKVTLIQDPAQLDRFIVFRVSHNDPTVVSSTISYLEDKYATLPGVGEFLRSLESSGLIYNPELALDNDQSLVKATFGSEGLSKFPTFRGWDNVLQYLSVKYSKKEPVYLDFIAGIVGNTAAKEAGDYIRDVLGLETTTSKERGEDVYDVFLQESFESGLPALLIGRFGLAKSSKVQGLADRNNAIYYRIDLQAADRTTLRGYPDKQDLSTVAVGGSLGTLLKAKLDSQGTPLSTTRFTPFSDFLAVVREVREDKSKHLVVMFDEMNRAEPVEQSAVFDAISEGFILGVDVSDIQKEGRLHIIAAGNVGDEYATSDFDAAAVARFAVVAKDTVSERDYDSFLRWAEEKFEPNFVEWLDQERKTFIDLINRESDTGEGLVSDVFSFRTLEVIHAAVASLQGTYILSSFMDDIPKEVALAVASSPKWRGNKGASITLKYRIEEGPDKGKIKRYAYPIDVIGDLEAGYVNEDEFYSDIIALDNRRFEQAMGFVRSSVPADVWLMIEDKIRSLIGIISKDAYSGDSIVKEASEKIAEQQRASISDSEMSIYDKIAKDIQDGKGIDPHDLYMAALKQVGDEDALTFETSLLAAKEVLENIDSLGLADVQAAIEAIDVASSNPTGPLEVVITPQNYKAEIARLKVMATVGFVGSIGLIPDYKGFSDLQIDVKGKDIEVEGEFKKSGVVKVTFNGSTTFGVNYGLVYTNPDFDMLQKVQDEGPLTFERNALSLMTFYVPPSLEASDQNLGILTITFRGFDVSNANKVLEVRQQANDTFSKEVSIIFHAGMAFQPPEESEDSDVDTDVHDLLAGLKTVVPTARLFLRWIFLGNS